MQPIITAIIASYILGSIPTAYLYGRIAKGIDIRKSGSGNVGATNALRVFGKKAGLFVLAIDIVKGIVPVVLFVDIVPPQQAYFSRELLRIIVGIACIAGHNWTVFLRFKGGKGVATTFGVIIGLALKIPAIAAALAVVILTWFIVFLFSKIVSLASIASAISFPVAMIILKQGPALNIFSFLCAAFIILRHLPNIRRILQGQEPRISFKK